MKKGDRVKMYFHCAGQTEVDDNFFVISFTENTVTIDGARDGRVLTEKLVNV